MNVLILLITTPNKYPTISIAIINGNVAATNITELFTLINEINSIPKYVTYPALNVIDIKTTKNEIVAILLPS